jgi:hypothetical protein
VIPLPHPPVELTWTEADDLAGLLGDAYRQAAWSGRDRLAARLLQAVEGLRRRQASARFLATAGTAR